MTQKERESINRKIVTLSNLNEMIHVAVMKVVEPELKKNNGLSNKYKYQISKLHGERPLRFKDIEFAIVYSGENAQAFLESQKKLDKYIRDNWTVEKILQSDIKYMDTEIDTYQRHIEQREKNLLVIANNEYIKIINPRHDLDGACKFWANKVYRVSDMPTLPPYHNYCRCVVVPATLQEYLAQK